MKLTKKSKKKILVGIILIVILGFVLPLINAQSFPYVNEIEREEGLQNLFSFFKPLSFFDVCSNNFGHNIIEFKNDGSKKTYWSQDYCGGGARVTVWRGSPYDGVYPSHPSNNREKVEVVDVYPDNGWSWSCDAGAYWNSNCYYDVVCCQEQTCSSGDVCVTGQDCSKEGSHYYYCDSSVSNKRYYALRNSDCSLETFSEYCPSNQYCDDGKCIQETSCSDSDSKNYQSKGYVDTIYQGSSSRNYDSCSSDVELYERYCDSNWIATEKVNCLSKYGLGYECDDGKCIKTTSGTQGLCDDSDDGKDVYEKGKVEGKYGNGNSFWFNDFCSVTDKSKVSEGFCVGSDPSSEWINCPYGTLCIDGACITQTNDLTCSNSDGICKTQCGSGEINIGLIDCSSDELCCREGNIASCPEGTVRPYCSDTVLDNQYLICNGGITEKNECKGNYKCSDGLLCYGLDRGEGGTVVDDIIGGLGDFFDKIREKIFGGDEGCSNCDAFATSYLVGNFFESYSCKPKLLAIPPQTISLCFFSFIKLVLVPIVLIFGTLFGTNFFQRNKLLTIKNKGLAFLVSLIIAGLLAWITFTLFWIGVIIFIVYIAFTLLIGGKIKAVQRGVRALR